MNLLKSAFEGAAEAFILVLGTTIAFSIVCLSILLGYILDSIFAFFFCYIFLFFLGSYVPFFATLTWSQLLLTIVFIRFASRPTITFNEKGSQK